VTLFLVGATGVLGRALMPRLVVRGHRVRAIARRRPVTRLPEGVEFIEADLLAVDLRRLVDGCDAVIHIATAIPSDPSAPGAWDDNTRLRTSGTRRLLAAAIASGVSRYVQQSIVMAYRDGGDAWLDEQTPLDDSPARATVCGPVIEMETMIREVEPQALAWTILRGGSFVGEGTGQLALLQRLRDGAVVVAGDGSNYVSLVNVADMAAAVAVAVEAAPPGSTFNVVDDPLRYGDYVDALADLIGVSRPAREPKMPLPPSLRCTNRAAQTVLGWMPRGRIWPYPNAA